MCVLWGKALSDKEHTECISRGREKHYKTIMKNKLEIQTNFTRSLVTYWLHLAVKTKNTVTTNLSFEIDGRPFHKRFSWWTHLITCSKAPMFTFFISVLSKNLQCTWTNHHHDPHSSWCLFCCLCDVLDDPLSLCSRLQWANDVCLAWLWHLLTSCAYWSSSQRPPPSGSIQAQQFASMFQTSGASPFWDCLLMWLRQSQKGQMVPIESLRKRLISGIYLPNQLLSLPPCKVPTHCLK